AVEPEALERLFVERVNAGDVEGLVALYEPDAGMAMEAGSVAVGLEAIRQGFEEFVASGVELTLGDQQPTVSRGGGNGRGRASPARRHLAVGDRSVEHARRVSRTRPPCDRAWLGAWTIIR